MGHGRTDHDERRRWIWSGCSSWNLGAVNRGARVGLGEILKPDYEAAAQVFRIAGYHNKGIRILLDQAVDAALAGRQLVSSDALVIERENGKWPSSALTIVAYDNYMLTDRRVLRSEIAKAILDDLADA